MSKPQFSAVSAVGRIRSSMSWIHENSVCAAAVIAISTAASLLAAVSSGL